MSDLFERLGECRRGGEPERLDAILTRVFVRIVRYVEAAELDGDGHGHERRRAAQAVGPDDDVQPGPGPDPVEA